MSKVCKASGFMALAALLVLGLSCSSTPGEEDVASDQSVTPKDVEVDTNTSEVEPDVEPIDYGYITLDVYAPTTCGCPTPLPEVPPKSCGWMSSGKSKLAVKALHKGTGYKGADDIKRVKLLYMGKEDSPEGELIFSTTSPGPSGWFDLELDADEFFFLKDSATGELINGPQDFRVLAVSNIQGPDGNLMETSLDLVINIDPVAPNIQVLAPKSLDENPFKAIETLSTLFYGHDSSSGLHAVRFYIDGEEKTSLQGITIPTKKQLYSWDIDISEYDTGTYELKIEAEDCLGNLTTTFITLYIVGMLDFRLPPMLPLSEEIGTILKIRVADFDQNDILDLEVLGAEGIGVAMGAGDGTFGDITPIKTEFKPTDALFEDITGDGNQDLVALVSGSEESQLHIYRQNTDEEFAGDGTFPEEPTEQHKVAAPVDILRLRDMNMDERPDVVIGGPEDEFCVGVMLHTGKTEGEPSGKYLNPPDVFTGVTSVVDIQFGDLNMDQYPDIVMGRYETSIISTIVNDKAGGFAIAHDTLVWPGTNLLAVDDLDWDGVDDTVVSATSQLAFYFLPGNGYGYFKALGFPTGGEHTMHSWGMEVVANIVDDEAFKHGTRESGQILSVGEEPDSMVLKDLSGNGIHDVAIAVPDSNLITIFLGSGDGTFRETVFANPGYSPESLVAGDFDGDYDIDLACIAGTDRKVTILLNEGDGKFEGPRDYPMPLAWTWTAGRLVPDHLAIADLDNSGTQDLVVATKPDKQYFEDYSGAEEPPVFNVSLILSFLADGLEPGVPAKKSTVSESFTQELSGFGVGLFNNDVFPDLAISVPGSPKSPCAGRNFDILVGRHMIDGIVPEEELECEGTEFYTTDFPNLGLFWPLGGFLGILAPSGLAVAALDWDDLDDVILFAPEQGSMEGDGYQPDMVATYLTKFSSTWNTCATYNQIGFTCAPYWPLGLTCDYVCSENVVEPASCLPASPEPDSSCPSFAKLASDPAKPSDATLSLESGKDPVAAVVDNFSPDPYACPDLLVANSYSGDVTYLRGQCGDGVFSFHNPTEPPHLFAVGENPKDIDAADLDGDGYPDATVALAGNISIAYGGTGYQFHTPEFLVGVGDDPVAPSSIVADDLNDDGLEDIMVTATGQHHVVVYLNAGNRVFFGPYILPCGRDPIDSFVKDMNKDGCDDVIVLNQGSRTVTILQNQRCF